MVNSPRVPKTLFQEGRRKGGRERGGKERERKRKEERKERKKVRKRRRGRKKRKKKGGQEAGRKRKEKKGRFSDAQLFSTDYSCIFPVRQNMPTCRKNGMMSLASQMRACVSQASLPSEGFCSAQGVQSPVVTALGKWRRSDWGG